MTNHSHRKNIWLAVRTHFLLDGLILILGITFSSMLRFVDPLPDRMTDYLPAVLLAAFALPSMIYGAGLYSNHIHIRHRYRFVLLALCYGGALVLMLSLGSIIFDARLGRGVLLISIPMTYLMLVLHHGVLIQRGIGVRERVVMLVSDDADLAVWENLKRISPPFYQITGMIDIRREFVEDGSSANSVGSAFQSLPAMAVNLRIDGVLCTKAQLRDPRLSNVLRNVSFSGLRLLTLSDVMEDSYRKVPLALVDLEWLLHASTLPHRSYVRKWKRVFDVVVSLVVGLVALPVFLAGVVWVRCISPEGPVFFRQVRNGRLGRKFKLLKLRTMKVDAEANGPQWAQKNDSRTFFGGGLLRKFRVDEIPQLLNILRGEMSFVGPRPERPEFEDQLAAEIPYFRERLLVAPGLTGWAQVNYPYGATVEDARRKLEYDLYYMKHMTLTLDLFILLDTARIVIGGGVNAKQEVNVLAPDLGGAPAVADVNGNSIG